MPTVDNYRLIARYNGWMNDKVYGTASQLSNAERRRDRGAFFKSIHGTLTHILNGDGLWMGRFEEMPFDWRRFDHDPHADFAALRSARVALDLRIATFVESLTAAWIAAPFEYPKLSGALVKVDGFAALTHFFESPDPSSRTGDHPLDTGRTGSGDTDIVAMPGTQIV